MKQFTITVFPESAPLEEVPGVYTLEEAFYVVHRDYLVVKDPRICTSFWTMDLDDHGIPEFFSFSPKYIPISDAGWERYVQGRDKVGGGIAPREELRELDWADVERLYHLPQGRVVVHISATDRQRWMLKK